jgi:hypothetical protein
VYNLVTRCFYNSEKRKAYTVIQSKFKKADQKPSIKYSTAKLLNRLLSYFDIKTVLVLADSSDFRLISEIMSIENSVLIDNNTSSNHSYDMIYLDINHFRYMSNIESLLPKMHNDSVIVLNSIHKSKTNVVLWNRVKEHPKITVTIDTFYLGFVFIRNEQVKEHFTIRM